MITAMKPAITKMLGSTRTVEWLSVAVDPGKSVKLSQGRTCSNVFR
jgi:hypothetical protein